MVFERIGVAGPVAGVLPDVAQRDQGVVLVGGVPEVFREGELVAALKPHAVAVAADGHQGDFALLQTDLGVVVAIVLGFVISGIVVILAGLVGTLSLPESVASRLVLGFSKS